MVRDQWEEQARQCPVCVLLILSHVSIMRPPLLQFWRAERAADAGRGDPSPSRRERQTEGREQSHKAARRLYFASQHCQESPALTACYEDKRWRMSCSGEKAERANGLHAKTPWGGCNIIADAIFFFDFKTVVVTLLGDSFINYAAHQWRLLLSLRHYVRFEFFLFGNIYKIELLRFSKWIQ